MCGTNGETYPSLCELLQDTGNEGVAYAGECDREECEGGEVSTPSQKHTITPSHKYTATFSHMLLFCAGVWD